MTIYAIYSDRPQCGKSTLRREIINELFDRDERCYFIPFAESVKEAASLILNALPLNEEQILDITDDLYGNKSMRLFNVSTREFLQFIGTSFGRKFLDPDIWVKAWRNKYDELITTSPNIVVDDMRFENEYQELYDHNATFIRITNRNAPIVNHESEGRLNHFHFDYEFDNTDMNFDKLISFAHTVVNYATP